MDREKVIKGLEQFKSDFKPFCGNNADWKKVDDAIDLMKEQEDLGTELTNAVELIHKKNERIEKLMKEQETHKFFVDESGKITPLPVVVRCKDCKHIKKLPIDHHGHQPYWCENLNIYTEGLCWFCADGERR